MKITITRQPQGLEASNENGNTLLMNGPAQPGEPGQGMRPMQLLLSALGGCSAMDAIAILEKQKQQIDHFEVELEGTREPVGSCTPFRSICLHFKIKGEIALPKADRAVQLSLEKYCSVAKTFDPQVKITYTITIY